jgi:vanillate O-demethylase monooxygenase subunit
MASAARKGKPGGGLHDIHPQEILAQVLIALGERVGFDPADVEDVVIGNGEQKGDHGNDISRMAVLAADWPIGVPGVSFNRFCGSGQQAIMFAAMGVLSGWQQLVVPTKCWYVAATCNELGDAPLGRRLLDRDIALWRSQDGQVAAFDDRCAHRGFPLSDGHVDGDRLVCGYHGCSYVTDGYCVHVPTQPAVPTGMRVRSFPILEEPPFIWIWLGPPAAASNSRPPRTPWLNDLGWSTFTDAWRVQSNYLMVHEHYLDFSYAPVIYRDDVPPGMERLPSFNEIEVTETTVSYTRLLPEAPLANWEAAATGLDPAGLYTRRESGTFASPALHIQRWELEADGTKYSNARTHAITPETDTATHIFMYASSNYAPNDEAVATTLQSFVAKLVDRDTAILERVAAYTGYDCWRSGVEFQADVAAIRATHRSSHARQGSRPIRPSARLGQGQNAYHQLNTSPPPCQ